MSPCVTFLLFHPQSVDDVMRFLEDGNVMEPPEGCPSSAQNIMLSCWHMEPEKRPTFENLKCMLESFKGERVFT